MDMEDDDRNKLLKLSDLQMQVSAKQCLFQRRCFLFFVFLNFGSNFLPYQHLVIAYRRTTVSSIFLRMNLSLVGKMPAL